MKYDKPPLSFEEQAGLLIKRGLVVDRVFLIDRLRNVNYYRLSGYLYPYRQPDDNFKPGTTFEKAWRHYTFDRRLRLIVMDAIERVEVSIRTQLICILAHESGAFGYTKQEILPNLEADDHSRWVDEINKEVNRSHEQFVEHFRKKYGDNHALLPLWMTGEIMSFGCILTMYRGMTVAFKKEIAAYYGIPDEVLSSWLQTINVIRNICAHHSRLWNRELGVKPYIPRKNKYPQWHEPVLIPQNRIFGVLTILRYLLRIIAPQSQWEARLLTLLDEYPEISRWSMGFPDGWKESPLWK
ncbi:MAG: Abi family protein [Candidatus Omnitrophica bacterium]|nr:Abi family protein [Candidatus Omnitrophota bacterium]